MKRFYAITALFVAVLVITSIFNVSGWIVALVIMAYTLVMVYASAFISSGFYTKAICRFDTSRREVAITFDDGPDEKTTMILDLLKEAGFKASFFCIGEKMEARPDITQRIVDEGHLLGNHTWSHNAMFPLFLPGKIKRELQRTNILIEQHTGEHNCFFRPPYGVTNPFVGRALKGLFSFVVGWSIRSLDTTNRSRENILNRIIPDIRPGQIILLHDTSEFVEQILKELICYLKNAGYQSVALHQLKPENNHL